MSALSVSYPVILTHPPPTLSSTKSLVHMTDEPVSNDAPCANATEDPGSAEDAVRKPNHILSEKFFFERADLYVKVS